MKKLSKKLLTVLLLTLAALCLFGFAACAKKPVPEKTAVTVDYAGGTLNNATSGSFEMDSDGDLDLALEENGYNAVVRTGYTFAGWDKPEKTDGKYAKSITVTAKWSAVTYTITYDLDGGEMPEGKTNPTSYTVEDAFTFEYPTKTGYHFAGFVAADGEEPFVEIKAGTTGNLTLKAVWSLHAITVKFYLLGDTTPSLTKVFSYQQTIAYQLQEGEEGLVISDYINKADGTRYTDLVVNDTFTLELYVDVYTQGMKFELKSASDYDTETEINFSNSFYAATITNADLNGAKKLYYPSYYNGVPVEVIEDANYDGTHEFLTELEHAYISANIKLIWSNVANNNVNFTGLFHDATALKEVVFAEGSKLQEIHEPGMFYNTTSLAMNIKLPDSLAYMGDRAFYNSGITGITLPVALTGLLNNTFHGATALTEIVIPEGSQLETIAGAFGSLAIPGVTSLDFSPATKLTSVSTLAVFTHLASVKFPDSLESIGAFASSTNMNDALTEIDLSNTQLTTLPSNAFQYVTKLVTVKFPATLESLGNTMFGTSSANGANTTTTEIDLSNTKITSVNAGAFNYMTALETVKFPATLKTIGSVERSFNTVTVANSRAIFYNGTSAAGTVVTLDFGGAVLETVGDYAFYNLPNLASTSLKIATDGTMGALVFAKSGALNTEITVEALTGANVSDAAFAFMTAATLNLKGFTSFGNIEGVTEVANLPAATTTNNGGSVTESVLATYPALLGSNVTKVTFDAALEELADFAFVYSSAQPVFASAADVEYGDYLFYKSKLTAFDFANTPFTNISEYMFYASENLATISNTDNIVTVGAYAFANTKVTSFNIGRNVEEIEATAFNGNGKMNFTVAASNRYYSLEVDANDEDDYILYTSRDGNTVSIFYDYKLMDATEPFDRDFSATELTEVGTAYANNTLLRSISFPATVTDISDEAFINCTALQSVAFLGLTAVGERAFKGCTSLVTLDIPATLLTIGEEAFSHSALAELTAPENSLLETVGASAFAYGSLNKLDLTKATHLKSLGVNAFANQSGTADAFTVLLPATADAEFTTLAAGLFANCAKLKSIEIPAYIVAFDSGTTGTFAKSGLTSLSFAENSHFAEFGTGALSGLNIKTLSLPDSLTTIGAAAFAGMTSLEEVTIPASVTTIVAGEEGGASTGTSNKRGAFAWCISLQTVTFEGDNVAIPAFTFYRCSALETVNFEKVASVGEKAFQYCSNLAELTFSAALTQIDANAFEYASKISKIDLSAATNLKPLGTNAFASAGLTSLTVTFPATADETFTELAAGLFANATGLKSIKIPAYITAFASGSTGTFSGSGLTELSFAEGSAFTSFGAGSLSGLNITKLSLPDSLETIGKAAFAGSALEEVTIPAGVTIEAGSGPNNADRGAFGSCESLKKVTFLGTDVTIPAYTFYNCYVLETINFSNVTSIGNYAFAFGSQNTNDKFTELNLSNVTSVGDYAFQYRALTSVDLSGATSIGLGAFYAAKSLSRVTFYKGESELTIGKVAFADCIALTSISLPANVKITAGSNTTGANRGAFGGCTGLETVTLSGNTEITTATFYGCTALTSVSFDKVTKLGNYAFAGCSALTSVSFGSSFSSDTTGTYIFQNCSALTSVSFTNNVALGTNAFENCYALANVDFDHITNYGASAFKYCCSLREAKIPSGMTQIPNYAFQYCASLVSVTIPSQVTKIGTSAFQYCYKLAVIVNQSSIALKDAGTSNSTNGYIEQYAKQIITDGSASTVLFDTADDALFSVLKNGDDYYLVSYNGTASTLVLPAELTLKDSEQTKVTSYKLYNYAFYYNTAITSITIPASVTAIGDYAFQNTSKLKTVTINGNGLTSIGLAAFQASGITSITIPASVTNEGGTFTAGTSATTGIFSGCTELTSVTFSGTGVAIPKHTFNGCSKLTTVNFANVSSIADAAFYKTGFTSLALPTTITMPAVTTSSNGAFALSTSLASITFTGTTKCSIPAYTFYGCTSLSSVDFTKVGSIGKAAFYNTGFTSLTLPAEIDIADGSSNSDGAFGGCTALSSVSFTGTSLPKYIFSKSALTQFEIPASVTEIGEGAFKDCASLTTLTFATGSTIAVISKNAFYGTGILSIDLPASVTEIADSAFQSATQLATVTFKGNSVASIGVSAFNGCTLLTQIDLSELTNLTTIGNSAFQASGITSVTLPSSVNSVGTNVFFNCKSLLSADLTNAQVTALTQYFFRNCSALTTVKLPKALSANGLAANALFNGCTSLTDIWYEGDAVLNNPNRSGTTGSGTSKVNNQAFYGCPSFTMHVKDATQYSDNWSSQFSTATNGVTFVTIVTEPEVTDPDSGNTEGENSEVTTPEAVLPGKESALA